MSDSLYRRLEREGYTLASIQARGFAYMIDELLISLLFAIIFWEKFSVQNSPEAMIYLSQSLFFYVLVVKTLYQTLFVWLYGATLGKMAMKIRVVESGYFDNPTLLQALNRAVVRNISEMLFYLGFLWAFFDPLRQAWHDKSAKTLVVDG